MNIQHVTNSALVGGCIANTGVAAGNILVLPDLLYFGPLRAISNTDFWQVKRVAYCKEGYASLFTESIQDGNYHIVNRSLNDLNDASEIWVWLSEDVNDQLMLIWLLQALSYFSVDLSKLYLQFVRTDPVSGALVATLSRLSNASFAALVCKHSAEVFNQNLEPKISAVWQALISPDPLKLNATLEQQFFHEDLTQGLIDKYIAQYPNITTGLSAVEMQVLAACGPDRQSMIDVILRLNSSAHDLSIFSDNLLAMQIARFASTELTKPLVHLEGDIKWLAKCSVTVTEYGRAVLAGDLNHVHENGIDKHIGGVHLQSSKGCLWWSNNGRVLKDI